MIIFKLNFHTHFAEFTVKEAIASTCLASSTLFTVEYCLASVIVEQVADLAKVFTEMHLALVTRLLWSLLCRTHIALDFSDGLAIEQVGFEQRCPSALSLSFLR